MARAAGAMTREAGAVLGVHVRGERALTRAGRYVILPPAWLCRHVLVCGATGSGKTETVLRLAWTLAGATNARVYYLDGKGDREAAERFVGVMADAGRTARVFPNERFDGWRGEAHEIVSRLLEVVDYAREGPAAWYRDVARNVVLLACEHPEGPPRSSRMLLERMDLEDLRAAHGPSRGALRALRAQQVEQVRLRYEAFFGQMRGALDGRWAWEDADAAYVLLDSLRMHEETAGVWRFMVEDFTHYFSARKPREQLCVLILDELAALAGMRGIAGRVEQGAELQHGVDPGAAGAGGPGRGARGGADRGQRGDGALPPAEHSGGGGRPGGHARDDHLQHPLRTGRSDGHEHGKQALGAEDRRQRSTGAAARRGLCDQSGQGGAGADPARAGGARGAAGGAQR
jgi:hypothetical protein